MPAQSITPCVWFDRDAEDAANFYVSVFKDGKPGKIAYYGEGAPLPTGTVLTVAFTLKGQDFRALNGGPVFKFTEAVSFMVDCQDQAEIDYFWDRLVEGGGEHSVCGWLKDRYGVSWPVAPHDTGDLISGPKRDKVTAVMMTMSRPDLARLEVAAKG